MRRSRWDGWRRHSGGTVARLVPEVQGHTRVLNFLSFAVIMCST